MNMNLDLGKAASLVENSSAMQRLNLLNGYEGVWVKARRDNNKYILNKVLSMGIAIFLAILTLRFKKTTQIYWDETQAYNSNLADDSPD